MGNHLQGFCSIVYFVCLLHLSPPPSRRLSIFPGLHAARSYFSFAALIYSPSPWGRREKKKKSKRSLCSPPLSITACLRLRTAGRLLVKPRRVAARCRRMQPGWTMQAGLHHEPLQRRFRTFPPLISLRGLLQLPRGHFCVSDDASPCRLQTRRRGEAGFTSLPRTLGDVGLLVASAMAAV